MITNLFLKSYNQSKIWRAKGREKNAPTRHDSVPMHSRWGFCPVSFWCCKNSQQKLFLAKTERGWEAAQRCATYPASSARARVQKCTKMQAGRSFDVASAKFLAFAHKMLEMSFNHIGLNNSCCWKRWWLIWWEALFYHKRQKADIFLNQKRYFPNPSWLHVWRRRCRHVLWQIVARWAWSRTRDTLVLKSNMDKRTSSIGEDLRFS